MEDLKSPLNNGEFDKINIFISENEKYLLSLSVNSYKDINYFKVHVEKFNNHLKSLSEKEKIRAWFYLYSQVKKAKQQLVMRDKNNSYINKRRSFNNYISLVITGVIIFIIALTVYFLFLSEPKVSDYDRCVINGIQYFKDIEAYPNLSDGSEAGKVAKERCYRSKVAFGPLD